jgi:hypothetical protein
LGGKREEGIAELREALRLEPSFENAQQNFTLPSERLRAAKP